MKYAPHINVLEALVSTLLAATPASSQPAQSDTVARLKEVSGNVLVTQQAGLSTGAASQRLTMGTRVITTANSEALVVFDNGCVIRVRENQRFDIEDKPCEALVPVNFGGTLLAAGASSGIPGFITPFAVVGAVVVLESGRGRTPVSPN